MKNVYDQHRASFPHVSAYCIMHGAERVATIAFKFPRDGAGRLYAYVHWLGVPMVRGHAGGYGYDKKSAACANACRKIDTTPWEHDAPGEQALRASFIAALAINGGRYWNDELEAVGFKVLQAV